jgi:hypothetical protein
MDVRIGHAGAKKFFARQRSRASVREQNDLRLEWLSGKESTLYISSKQSVQLALLLQLASASLMGCGGDDSPKTAPTTTPPPSAAGTPEVDTSSSIPFTLPGGSAAVVNALYSGYDGVHDYQIPLMSLVPNVRITIEDDTLAEVRQTGTGVMIKTKKAGMTFVVGKAGNLVGKIPLTITAFTPADWTTGSMRYFNMKSAFSLYPPCDFTDPGLNKNASCANCHVSQTFGAVIRHTPMQAAGYSDEEITNIFTKAIKPPGWKQHFMETGSYWKMFHKWSMTTEETRGIIAYLRSLEPQDMGEFRDPSEQPPPEDEFLPPEGPEVDETNLGPNEYICQESDGGTGKVTLPPRPDEDFAEDSNPDEPEVPSARRDSGAPTNDAGMPSLDGGV